MPMDAVEDIKSRLSIEDVIGRYVELKRAGRNFKGLSPFTNEKTPSLMVSPEKQIWHDFSSSKGGNIFSFVMEMEGVDFKGALEQLARQAGVDLSLYRSNTQAGRSRQKERLQEALELATRYYQVQLTKNTDALTYVRRQRQFKKETMLEFRLGYAPDDGTALTRVLTRKGFQPQELKAAGLTTLRYQRPTDMFRGRLMIPLMDPFGKVVGFTARLLIDNPNAPKYINTPQTVLYDKSRHIFGLHLAKQAIRQSKFAVLVEGNLDVIASHQAGIHQTVATAGTAVTEPQLKALSRLTYDVRLSFDQDEAGLRATERAIPLANKSGLNLSIITISGGKDPDEVIRKDPHLWVRTVQDSQYALDWLISHYQKQTDIGTAEGKRKFSDNILPIIRDLTDTVEQDHYLRQLADLLGVSQESLKAKFLRQGKQTPLIRRKTVPPQALDPVQIDSVKAQNQLLALAWALPSIRPFLKTLLPEMLPDKPARQILQFLHNNPDYNNPEDDHPLLKEVNDYVRILKLLYEEFYQGLEVMELRYEAARLQVRLVERYVKSQKAELALQMRTANETQTKALLNRAKELDKLLQSMEEVEKAYGTG